jgi:GT2 family glycosyltransferase
LRATTASLEGYLESPGPWHPATGSLVIAGWVFSRERPIRAVELAIDGGAPVALAYGVQRTDVERLHPTEPSRASGFGALVPLADSTQPVVRIELFVTLDDGRRMPWMERDVRLYEAGPVARLTRVASVVMNAARTAISTRRLPPEPQMWAGALLRHWQGVPYHQPVRREKPEPFNRARFERSYRSFLATLADQPIPHEDLADVGHVDVVVLGGKAPLDWLIDATRRAKMAAFWVVWSGERPSDAQRGSLDRCAADRLRHAELGELSNRDGRWQPPGTAECVVLIDERTVPIGAGLARAVRGLRESHADWVYTDDDRVDANGQRLDAYFKGGFSPELLLFDDSATRLAAVRRDAITRAGGLSATAGDAQLVDLLFRVWRNGGRVHHLADVCCHRLEPVSSVPSERHRTVAREAVAAATNGKATIELSKDSRPRVHWSRPALNARVTIVIPTRDRVELLRACVDTLNRTVDPGRADLLIVDDRSERVDTREYLDRLSHDSRVACRVLRAPDVGGPFNYSRLMNLAAEHVLTPLLLHLNNDIEAIEPGWLDQLAGWLSDPLVGAAGAKLIYRDGSIQHAGVFVSPWHGTPDHLFRRLAAGDPGYQWLADRTRNVSAVTGACLLTRTALYRELGGFDAEHLAVQFNDVDYCLRLAAQGFRIVYEPAAVLYHDESASRGRAFDYRENAYFQATHRDYRDPFVSPQLDADSLCGATPVVMSPARAR